MDEISAQRLFEAVDQARIALFTEHCATDEDQTAAVVHLSTLFLYQMHFCLSAVYEGNEKLINAHIMLVLSKGFPSEGPPINNNLLLTSE